MMTTSSSMWSRPSVWGTPTWKFLYCVVQSYPRCPSLQEREEYAVFFHSLQWILPCRKCRSHYQQWLTLCPVVPFLRNRTCLQKWLLWLDNYIRQRLEKPLIENMKQEYFGRDTTPLLKEMPMHSNKSKKKHPSS